MMEPVPQGFNYWGTEVEQEHPNFLIITYKNSTVRIEVSPDQTQLLQQALQ